MTQSIHTYNNTMVLYFINFLIKNVHNITVHPITYECIHNVLQCTIL